MSFIREDSTRNATLRQIAEQMMVAARTAPKARGTDNLIIGTAFNETIRMLSDKMKEIGERENLSFFFRDSVNILHSTGVVLIGTRIKSLGLNCGLCGFKTCMLKDKSPSTPCVFNTHDLGIAVGSAVSVAADNRVDNRVMFSVGRAAYELNLLGEDVPIIFGIPLSASAKNPFFDRQ